MILRPDAKVTPDALREFLSDKLAAFKIPRRIVVVDQLPKGISGKVQRKRLSEMMNGSAEGPAPVESRLHSDLIQIWKKILKTDAISVDDDFFEKGGNSLLAMDVSAGARAPHRESAAGSHSVRRADHSRTGEVLAGEIGGRA